jgi:hypothetical protein
VILGKARTGKESEADCTRRRGECYQAQKPERALRPTNPERSSDWEGISVGRAKDARSRQGTHRAR